MVSDIVMTVVVFEEDVLRLIVLKEKVVYVFCGPRENF